MNEAVFWRVLAGCAAGFMTGAAFVLFRLRRGLTADEWNYFKAFLCALRNVEYTVTESADGDKGETEG